MIMRFKISHWQLFLIVFLTSFCVTPFGFGPLQGSMGRHIWIASLIQLVVTLLGGLGVVIALSRFPEQSLKMLSEQILGSVLGRLYLMLLAIYLFLWGPIGNQTVLVRMVQAAELPFTATLFLVGFLLAVAT